MSLTLAHYVYLAGLTSLVVVMVCRKTVLVPALVATLLTAVAATGSLAVGVASVFRASLVAASELFTIFLIIALVTAMLAALREVGAERRMVAPFRRVMVNGPVSYVALFAVTYVFSLFFWPTPTLALVAAILLPAAVRAGLSPLGGAVAIAIGGQGMALASDYVIGVAPQLSASGAGVSADLIADRALVLSLIVGGVAAAMCYVLTVRPSMREVPVAARAAQVAAEVEAARSRPETVWATVGNAVLTKLRPAPARTLSGPSGAVGGGPGPSDETGAGAEEPAPEVAADSAPSATSRAAAWAVVVPLAFLVLLGYMLLGRFTDVVTMTDGAGASLVGGTAALLMLGIGASAHGAGSLERSATHLVDGLVFAFKAMGVVVPIAGFVYLGISDFSGRILGLEDGAEAPAYLFDAIESIQHLIPGNPVFTVLAVMFIGMLVGLDGSGWAGLPLTGSLSEALSQTSGVDTATLAAIAQNAASWTGGGTLVIWSSLIAVAGFCGVNVVTLARRLFLPVVTGLVLASLASLVLW